MSQITNTLFGTPFDTTAAAPDVPTTGTTPEPSSRRQFAFSLFTSMVVGGVLIAGVHAIDPIGRLQADDALTFEHFGPAPNFAQAVAIGEATDAEDAALAREAERSSQASADASSDASAD